MRIQAQRICLRSGRCVWVKQDRRDFDSESRRYTWYREPFLVKEQVKIEEWTYNLGTTRFVRYLRFENGILTEIRTGDKGF
jgi:hypothetical protein